jgi:PhnB protein
MELKPYVFFYGRCEEALEFYKKVLGGTYEMQRIGETPMASEFPPGSEKRIMHATFKAPGISFFASDGQDTKPIDPDAGNVSLALAATDDAEGERLFKVLSEGGKITMPLEDVFWGGRFGVVQDRFGNEWMLSVGGPD